MSFIKKFKKETTIIAVCVIALTITTLGFSYAAFFDIGVNTNEQVINSGELSVSYGNETSSVVITDLASKTDEEGLKLPSQSIIYVQNNSAFAASFNLAIGYDYSSFTSDASYVSTDKLVPLEYLRAAVFEYNPSDSTSTQISEVINLGDIPIQTIDTSNNYNNTYTMFASSLDYSSSGNSNKTYTIKIWLSENAAEYTNNYKVHLKLDVVSGATNALTEYEISGKVLDKDSNPVTNAKISLQNGAITTTTNDSGEYTLTNVRENIYKVDITSSTNVNYSGTIKVTEDSTEGLSKYVNSHTVTTGNSLSGIAYTYGTTIKAVRNKNNMYNNSNEYNLEVDSIIKLPDTYIITGGSDEKITGININLGTDNISSLSKE